MIEEKSLADTARGEQGKGSVGLLLQERQVALRQLGTMNFDVVEGLQGAALLFIVIKIVIAVFTTMDDIRIWGSFLMSPALLHIFDDAAGQLDRST